MRLSRKCKSKLTGHVDGNILLWDLNAKALVRTLSGHTAMMMVHSVPFYCIILYSIVNVSLELIIDKLH